MQADIEDEIGAADWEGCWSAIRRAVERPSVAFGKEVRLDCGRKMMMAGRTEDLKAIWDNVE